MKLYVIIATVIFVIDQVVKHLVRGNLAFGESVPVIGGLLNLTHITNTGAAFGIMGNFTWLLVVLSILIIAGVIYIIALRKITCGWQKWGLAFTLGGALGNLFDRIVLGSVVDFLDISPLFNFPVFNIADVFIVMGAIILIVTIIFMRKEKTEDGL